MTKISVNKTKKKSSHSKKNKKKSKKHKAVNKAPKSSHEKVFKEKPKQEVIIEEYPGISIITCTMRDECINNVFENYIRQDYPKKEMIIVLNNNKINVDQWKKEAEKYENIKVFQLDEKINLGKCLNFGVIKSKYEYIAKFDDDDYYGPKYLKETIKAFYFTDAAVVGKRASFVYFKNSKILAIRYPSLENKYVSHMDGPTLIIKREVFNKVKFADIPRAVDVQFCKDCRKKGIKIYSTDRFHHVYIRQEDRKKHTWKITDKELLRWCKIVKRNVTDFEQFVNK